MNTAVSIDSPALRRRDWQIILLIGIAHASSHFFQLLLPSLYVSLGQEFDLDFARLGLLVSVFYVVSGLGQASSGFVVDRVGARPVLWFGLSCFVLSAVIIGAANGYPMLILAAAIGGVGNSIFHPADYSIINHRVSPARLGHAYSTHGLTGNLGWALTPVFITTITLLSNWRVAAFSAGALVALVLLMTVVGRHLIGGPLTQHSDEKAPQGNAWQTLKALLAKPALWGAFLFFAFTSVALSSVQNYTIPLLAELYDLSRVVASSALSGYMVASAVGMAAGGIPGLGHAAHRAHRYRRAYFGRPDVGGVGHGLGACLAGGVCRRAGWLLCRGSGAVARYVDPQGDAQGSDRLSLWPGVFRHGCGVGTGTAGFWPAARRRAGQGAMDRRRFGLCHRCSFGAVDRRTGAATHLRTARCY